MNRLQRLLSASTLVLLVGCSSPAGSAVSGSVATPAPEASRAPSAAPPSPLSTTSAARQRGGSAAIPPAPAPVPTVPVTGTDLRTSAPDPAQVPVRLEIDSIDVSMAVLPVGVDRAGGMAIPASVSDVGWYAFGPRPGENGATVLAAHVDSFADGLGPFARLRGIHRGSTVVLTTQDGVRHRYRVATKDTVSKPDVPWGQVFDRTGAQRLTMVTCGGAYRRSTGYSDNVVVSAEPVAG